jgi:hypothetical protein
MNANITFPEILMNTHIQTFLSLVYACRSSWIALCLIPPESDGRARTEHRFTRVDQLGQFLAYARFRNAHGWGIYLTPSLLGAGARNRRKSSFQEQQQIVYLDCDRRWCLESIRTRFVSPTLVVRTSPGRHQVYWRLEQPLSIARQERLMRAMAQDVGADTAATDVSRVLRLPSFWNRKPDRNNTVDLVFQRDHAVRYESLWNSLSPSTSALSATSVASTRGEDVGVLGAGIGARHSLGDGASASERDWYQVHRRLALGSPPDELIAWLEHKRTDKRNPKYYAERTVAKALAARTSSGDGREAKPLITEPTRFPSQQRWRTTQDFE